MSDVTSSSFSSPLHLLVSRIYSWLLSNTWSPCASPFFFSAKIIFKIWVVSQAKYYHQKRHLQVRPDRDRRSMLVNQQMPSRWLDSCPISLPPQLLSLVMFFCKSKAFIKEQVQLRILRTALWETNKSNSNLLNARHKRLNSGNNVTSFLNGPTCHYQSDSSFFLSLGDNQPLSIPGCRTF